MIFTEGDVTCANGDFAGEVNAMNEATSGRDAGPQQVRHLCVNDVANGGRRGLSSLSWGKDCTLVHFQVEGVKDPLDLAGGVCSWVSARPHDSYGVVLFGASGAMGEGGAHVGLDGQEVKSGVVGLYVARE